MSRRERPRFSMPKPAQHRPLTVDPLVVALADDQIVRPRRDHPAQHPPVAGVQVLPLVHDDVVVAGACPRSTGSAMICAARTAQISSKVVHPCV